MACMGLPLPSCAGLGLAAAVGAADPVALRDAQVTVPAVANVSVGGVGELSLTILEPPMPGAPIELWLTSEHLVFVDNRLGWEDVVDPQARQPRIRARFTAPEEPGTYEVRGFVMYVTCGPKRCRPRTKDVGWTVTVEPAQPPSS